MDDLSSRSAYLLKTVSSVSRIALWVVLVAWVVLVCAWGSLHLFIVPRIGDFRPQLEAKASQALGVKVQIGAISAHSEGLIPSFELSDVRLLDAAGHEALNLPRVVAALSPRSLWNLSFQQLYIERPQLDIRRLKDGRIQVAGLDMSPSPDDHRASDWFFSQTEVAILGGSLQWTDEQREVPTLDLQQVDIVIRNQSRRHELRIDATPPAEWGDRFSLVGRLRQPLLSLHQGRWREWDGELHAAFTRVDVARLGRYAPLGLALTDGSGTLRAWLEVKHGQMVAATADVALSQVTLKPGLHQKPFSLASLTGRLGAKRWNNGFEFSTEHLQFVTGDGVRWSGGNARFSQTTDQTSATEHSELQADQLDLATLTQVASNLPLNPQTHAALLLYAPQGLVEKIQARWQGTLDQPSRYDVKGRVTQFQFEATDPAQTLAGEQSGVKKDSPPLLGRPGVKGVTLDFDLNQAGGRAQLTLKDGHLVFPGLFEEPRIPMAQLSTDVQWQIDGERLKVQLPNLKFSNPDAQGEAQLKWQSAESGPSNTHSRFPGVLDLQGTLSRADGARVYRYLPQLIHAPAREYLREAVTQGKANSVKFRVKGDLRDMPFTDPRQGDFQVSARFSDASLNYVPRSLQAVADLPWPGLSQMNGELLIQRSSLELKGVSGKVNGAQALRITRAEAQIPDMLKTPVVKVSLDARGPLNELLERGILSSPVAAMTNQILDQAVVSGPAELQLKLGLPLTDLTKVSVQGKLGLMGNDLQIFKDLPRLRAARGTVHFTEKGFAISGGQARFLGGEVRAEGGTIHPPGARVTAGEPTLNAQGSLSAEGLRQAPELGALGRMLGENASGATTYSLMLDLHRGRPELLITSNLQGLTLKLPAPLGKTAETMLPIRLQNAVTLASAPTSAGRSTALQDLWWLSVGRLASVIYVRDVSGAQPQVLRGAIGIGLDPMDSVPMPPMGVIANVNLDHLDIDAWTALLPSTTTAASGSGTPVLSSVLTGYLPTSLAIRAKELTAAGRKINQLVVGSTREGSIWRANLDAKELNGYLEYRQSSGAGAGRLYARLARLSLAAATARDVETLLDEQPVSIPALDIIVDDMELRGKHLGRVEIEAVNRGATSQDAVAREWRLNKFNISMPEASLTATGNWAVLNTATPPRSRATGATPEKRRTVMDFKLDLQDAGQLLDRLGMQGVVRQGQGKMEGQVTWIGSPLALDYPTLGGAFHINVERGQFLKADPGIAKLLGVLSLQALPRRLVLDFRDVFSDGFSFDSVRGDVRIEQGMAMTNNLQMKGVNAAVLMEGRADIAKETQDLKVVVVPEISAGTASLIAGWVNPVVGLGTFLAQWILSRPLIASNTQEFQISGSWADPKITKVEVIPDNKSQVKP